ncbi:hypothetical protein Poli38472_001961 [Pythium oligandrum]|uniref:Uncharacterized protein n=1 Tax=Pythium oligandrum TaxID=41045 RepID=A0A8K1CUF2_PYTOL|nr:hypothetical protein Poli38472_001961 [Pythium oligandrum]|eukprot:TMW69805.1 hypothetical protein Poli38472_001961 [Pythium oligandrum]
MLEREMATTMASTSAEVETSARTKRMLLTLKKALDVSISSASTVNLRAFFEKECRDAPELVQQLFAGPSRSAKTADEQDAVAGELSAEALQKLRQRIETAFHELCEKHRINEQLLTLEATIEEAQKAKIQKLASEQFEQAQRESLAPSKSIELADDAEEPTQDDDLLPEGGILTPEQMIRAERIRVMETEKKELKMLLRHLQTRKEEKQSMLTLKREAATSAVHQLEQVTQQLHDATMLAKDYSV